MSDIILELRKTLGEDAVMDSVALASRARNYWDSSSLPARALGRPKSTAELARVMSVCHARGQTVVVLEG
jgi:FAD/FMN-containing dehydrogenase